MANEEARSPSASKVAPSSSADLWLGPRVLILAVLIAVFAWWCGRPPRPVPDTAPTTVFSSARALDDLRVIARAPHPTGSAEHARVRRYIVERLERHGLQTEIQETTALLRAGPFVRAVTVRNILGRLPGNASTGAVALVTHYDSEIHTPAAGDISAGVAVILETVRAIQAGAPLRNDLLVIITYAEELGLVGAQVFVDEHPWMDEIALVLNFEGRGAAGPATMFEPGAENGWVVAEFARADPYPMGSSLGYEIYKYLPNDTDFSRFKETGVAGLNFAYIEAADRYHRSTDTIENLSTASLQHHGEHALALARHFGNLDLSHTAGPDVAFFEFPVLGMVVYPLTWALPMTAGVLALFLVILVQGFRRRRVRVSGLLMGFLLFLLSLTLAGALSWLFAGWVTRFHPELGSLVGTALYDEHWYVLAVIALTLVVVAALYGFARRWFRPGELALGAALEPLVGAIATAIWWPGANALLLWPLLFALLGIAYILGWPDDHKPGRSDALILLVCTVPALVFVAQLAWMLAIAMSILLAPLVAIVVVVYVSLAFPLLELTGRPNRWWLPVTALLASAAFVLIGIVTVGPDADRPAPSTLAYVVDRDLGSAYWVTTQAGNDGWVEQFVGVEVSWEKLDHLIPGAQRQYRIAEAPVDESKLAGARVEVLDDLVVDGVRNVRVAIRSTIGAEKLQIEPLFPATVSLRSVNGKPVAAARNFGGSDDLPVGEWQLEHWGTPVDGVVLELQSGSADEPIELILLETIHELPQLPGAPNVRRPPHLAPNVRSLTDQMTYRQAVVF